MHATTTLFLKHSSGALHALRGRRLAKLIRELKAGRGGPEVTALVEAGYEGYLGPDGEVWSVDTLSATSVTRSA